MGRHRHYVYTLAYPDGRVFYVGKGVNDRIADHERQARQGVQSKKCDIIRSIWAQGGQVVRQRVAYFDAEERALEYEHHLILSLEGLVNHLEGSNNFTEIVIDPADERVFGASIRRLTEDGEEYWSGREVANYLGYAKWDIFKRVVARAAQALTRSGLDVSQEIREVQLAVLAGKDSRKEIDDYNLSRTGFLLILQNADSAKSMVAYGKTYIAKQALRATAPNASDFSVLGQPGAVASQELQTLFSRTPQMKLRRAISAPIEVSRVLGGLDSAGGCDDVPTPPESIQEVQRKERKRIEQQRQPSLFDEPSS